MIFDKLKQFRQSAYTLLGKAKDAIFDLMDAVLTSPRLNSFVELSLSPVFRRAWSSLYAGLRQSRPPRRKLMKLYVEQVASEERPVLAGDHTAWPRPEAVNLKDRKERTSTDTDSRQQANRRGARLQHHRLDTRGTRQLGFTLET